MREAHRVALSLGEAEIREASHNHLEPRCQVPGIDRPEAYHELGRCDGKGGPSETQTVRRSRVAGTQSFESSSGDAEDPYIASGSWNQKGRIERGRIEKGMNQKGMLVAMLRPLGFISTAQIDKMRYKKTYAALLRLQRRLRAREALHKLES
jgi:hypothetical protein